MDILQNFIDRHPKSVGRVFSKYRNAFGKNRLQFLQPPINKKKLAAAIWWLRDTPFSYELAQEALLEEKAEPTPIIPMPAASTGFDDDDDDLDGYDYLKGKERRRQKQAEKRANKPANAGAVRNPEAILSGINIGEDPGSDDAGGSGTSRAGKVSTAFGIIGGVAQAAGSIASSIAASKNPGADTGFATQQIYPEAAAETAPESGMKKYTPYIIGGVVLLVLAVGAFFYLKKRG